MCDRRTCVCGLASFQPIQCVAVPASFLQLGAPKMVQQCGACLQCPSGSSSSSRCSGKVAPKAATGSLLAAPMHVFFHPLRVESSPSSALFSTGYCSRAACRAAQTVILSHCKGRVAAAGAAAGPKKEKDLTEAMTQAGGGLLQVACARWHCAEQAEAPRWRGVGQHPSLHPAWPSLCRAARRPWVGRHTINQCFSLSASLLQVAARALHQVLAMGAAGGAAGLAAVLELAPAPSAHAADEAALPPVEGGWAGESKVAMLLPSSLGSTHERSSRQGCPALPSDDALGASLSCACPCWPSTGAPSCLPGPTPGLSPAQSTVAQRLPLLHELFCAARKPSCAKELEQLCACLALAAGALPPPLAGGLTGCSTP